MDRLRSRLGWSVARGHRHGTHCPRERWRGGGRTGLQARGSLVERNVTHSARRVRTDQEDQEHQKAQRHTRMHIRSPIFLCGTWSCGVRSETLLERTSATRRSLCFGCGVDGREAAWSFFYNRKITCLSRLLHMHSAGSPQARQAAEICDGPSLPS